MNVRFSASLLALALVATACSSADLVSTTVPADETNEANDTVAADSGVFPGPTTTFVPPLDGPFGGEGGASTADVDPAAVIIDDDPDLPSTLAGLPWDTDWTKRTVDDWSEFLRGLQQTDPRDGIPPIDQPVFESVALASEWLGPREPGALVQLNGEARFYPLSIMTAHEIVNDVIGNTPVAVTYCPLCNTAISFDRRVDGEVLRFGVSGLLRNSDLVMWDDQTTSLWQQVTGEGVVGTHAGVQLDLIVTSIVSFDQFRENFPDGKSLAAESARGRGSYGRNPYVGYSSSPQPFLFAGEADDRLPALSRVVGVTDGDVVASYSFERLQQEQVVNDVVEGREIAILWAGDTADALDMPSIASSEAIGTGIAYDATVDGEALTFSANGDGTFTDDQTGSSWTIVGQAVDGPLEGSQLEPLVHRNEFWFAWQAFFGAENLREA